MSSVAKTAREELATEIAFRLCDKFNIRVWDGDDKPLYTASSGMVYDRVLEILNESVPMYAGHAFSIERAGKPDRDETAWLVEKFESGANWYLCVGGLIGWTKDPLEALRLSRREDAERVCFLVDDADQVAEHEWVASTFAKAEKTL